MDFFKDYIQQQFGFLTTVEDRIAPKDKVRLDIFDLYHDTTKYICTMRFSQVSYSKFVTKLYLESHVLLPVKIID